MASSLPISQEELKSILITAGVIKENDWVEAERNAARRRRGIEEVLIERGFFNERYLYELIGDAIKIPYVNLRKRRIDPEAIVCLDAKIAEEIQAIPFSLDNDILKIAFVDPRNQEHIEAVQANVKYKFKPFMTSARNFAFAFRLYQRNIKEELYNIINSVSGDNSNVEHNQLDTPIIKIVDSILEYAMFEQASDIHIEALPDAVVVRFRVDGDLHDEVELPVTMHDAIIARIKILSNLRIDEHRIPQDGRFSFRIANEEESVRVSIIPAFYGEKIVMRLLTDEAQNLSLEDIGFAEKHV